MLITEIILLASLSIPGLSVLFSHVRIYLLYRLLNDRIGSIAMFGLATNSSSLLSLPGFIRVMWILALCLRI